MITDDATIFALGSGAGKAGVAVIRVSGRAADRCVKQMCRSDLPSPRRASHRGLYHPKTGELLDRGLVIRFPGPGSFTGEDVAEFHIHGGRASIAALLEAIGSVPGTRPAEPGEFTQRGFRNGKFDLTRAEGIADLVAAETAAQRKQALLQLDGVLSELYEDWRERLVRILAHAEATVDFSEEELLAGIEETGRQQVTQLLAEIRNHLELGQRGARVREGVVIAIIGAPNVGKSSLLNAIVKRDVSIVAETAGTTRDVVEAYLELGGFPVIVCDTAGLRESRDEVEREGVRRALVRAERADLRIAVFDGQEWPDRNAVTGNWAAAECLCVWNKCDLLKAGGTWGDRTILGTELFVSAKTGEGIEDLLTVLQDRVAETADPRGNAVWTRERHRAALTEVVLALERAFDAGLAELAIEDLRMAVRALGRITGTVDVEELLDVIFRDFCIGK